MMSGSDQIVAGWSEPFGPRRRELKAVHLDETSGIRRRDAVTAALPEPHGIASVSRGNREVIPFEKIAVVSMILRFCTGALDAKLRGYVQVTDN